MLFADLLSLHLVTFLMIFILVAITSHRQDGRLDSDSNYELRKALTAGKTTAELKIMYQVSASSDQTP